MKWLLYYCGECPDKASNGTCKRITIPVKRSQSRNFSKGEQGSLTEKLFKNSDLISAVHNPSFYSLLSETQRANTAPSLSRRLTWSRLEPQPTNIQTRRSRFMVCPFTDDNTKKERWPEFFFLIFMEKLMKIWSAEETLHHCCVCVAITSSQMQCKFTRMHYICVQNDNKIQMWLIFLWLFPKIYSKWEINTTVVELNRWKWVQKSNALLGLDVSGICRVDVQKGIKFVLFHVTGAIRYSLQDLTHLYACRKGVMRPEDLLFTKQHVIFVVA